MCLHDFPPGPLRFSWKCSVLWDRLKANISRMFQIYHSPLLKLLVFFFFSVKMMRNNGETSTERNKSAQYKVKSRHYKWLFLITENLFKKSFQFPKHSRAYLRKGRYAPAESKKLNLSLNNEWLSSPLIKYNSIYVCKSQKKTNHRYLAITERCTR